MSENLHNLPIPDNGGSEPTEQEVNAMARVLAAQELAKARAQKIVKEHKEKAEPVAKRFGKSVASSFKRAGEWVSEKTDELEAKKEEREVERIARDLAEEELVEAHKAQARRILAERKENKDTDEIGETEVS